MRTEGPILAFAVLILVIAGQNYVAVRGGRGVEVLSSYIGIPIFLGLLPAHQISSRSKLVKLKDMDLSSPGGA